MDILFKNWVPVILWSGLIFAFSSIPNLKLPSLGLGFEDKIYHFTEFFIWGALYAKSYKMTPGQKSIRGFMIALVIGMAFALLDEGHQRWIPGRGFDWKDLLSNWSGLACSLLFLFFLKK